MIDHRIDPRKSHKLNTKQEPKESAHFSFRRVAKTVFLCHNCSPSISTAAAIMQEATSAALKKTYQLTKLTVMSIIPDLLCFTPLEATGLLIFAASSVVFSFIDFNHLTDPANNPSIYNTVNDRLAGSTTYCVEAF